MLGDALDLQKMSAIVRVNILFDCQQKCDRKKLVKSKLSKISLHENYD